MSVTWDALGSVNAQTTTGSAITQTLTAASGADVYWAVATDRSTTLSSITCAGNAYTTEYVQAADAGIFGSVYLFRWAGAGTGSSLTLSMTPAASSNIEMVPFSLLNVNSVASNALADGSSTSPASGSTTLTTGQFALNVLGSGSFGGTTTIGSATGSGVTNKVLSPSSGGNGNNLCVGYSSTSGVTFGATLSATNLWSSITLVLNPKTGNAYSDGANRTVMFTPTMVGKRGASSTANRTIAWANSPSGPHSISDGANRAIAFTPTVVGHKNSTSTANRTVTFTPTIVGPLGPFEIALGHLASKTSCSWQFVGDSTIEGVGDTAAIGGWVGRFGMILGSFYGFTVVMEQYGGSGDGIYGSPQTLYTAPGGSPPVITLLNGGIGGTGINSNDLAELSAGLLPIADPDVIIIGTGLNDLGIDARTTAEFASDMQTFVTDIQGQCPNVPIIITTENSCNPLGVSDFPAGIDAMLAAFGVGNIPLSPVLQTTNVTGVWALDSQAALGYDWELNYLPDTPLGPGTMGDSFHPTNAGYLQEAGWYAAQLAPDSVQAISDGANLTMTVNRPIGGSVPRSDHANTTVTVARAGTTVRNTAATANRSITATVGATTVRGARATANTTVTAARTAAGKFALKGTAPRSIVPVFDVGTGSVADGANLTITFTPATTGASKTELAYFTATGYFYNLESPDVEGTTSAAQFVGLTGGFVTFTPRVPPGTVIRVSGLDLGSGNIGSTAVALAPITGRIIGTIVNGSPVWALCAINTVDSPGVELIANNPLVAQYLAAQNIENGQLIYDVLFDQVTYAGQNQYIQPYAFQAPTGGNTPVCITDPSLATLPYRG